MWDKGEKALLVGFIILIILIVILRITSVILSANERKDKEISCQCQNCVEGGKK